MVFCTLFDSYYLDKGIALYNSLKRVAKDFKLYIYAFDDKAYEVLTSMKPEHAVILKESDLRESYPILERLKEERSKAEYSWTCTPVSIEYVLDHFGEESCTYIDADLFFFKDPQVLEDEIKASKASTVITPHRFSDSLKDRRLLNRSGKYCVEFNYFDNSTDSREALTWWRDKCFEWCFHKYEKDRMGDQKYIEKFTQLFKGVHELENLGGGVAPWNLAQYEYTGRWDGKAPILKEKRTGREFPVVFYHFQSMRYINPDLIIIRSETHSRKTKDVLYRPYLIQLEKVRRGLKKRYGVSFDVRQAYASNPSIRLAQKYILRFKLKSLSDVYNLKKLRQKYL